MIVNPFLAFDKSECHEHTYLKGIGKVDGATEGTVLRVPGKHGNLVNEIVILQLKWLGHVLCKCKNP